MRYVLLDKITEIQPGKLARGLKCVTLTDEVLHDHFPGLPILPGVLVLEAAAQLAGFLLEISLNVAGDNETAEPKRALMVQISKAKFHRPAQPGDAIALTATMGQSIDSAAQVDIEATIAGERAMRGTLTFMMKDVPSQRVHEQRRYLYELWTRDLDMSEIPIP